MSLQRQHLVLLRKIASKQKELERLKRLVEEAEQQLHERVEPIAARCRQKNEEIWSMFQALLAELPTKRGRRAVREVLQALVSQGIVFPVEAEVDSEFRGHSDPAGDDGAGASARERPTDGGYSAAPRGAEPGRDTLKAVFKRLTLAFHPDRTKDATEKLARTALMQSVTQAYQIGDLASLLRLERKSATLGTPAVAPDEASQCLAMERVVEELRSQLSELKNDARQLERAEALQFFSAEVLGQPGKSLDGFVRTVEAELDELTRIADFVGAFRKKELSLDEFLCGPVFQFGGAEFDFDDLVRGTVVEALESRGRARRDARRKRGRR
ncbi:MAG TPA: hypothetical protein VFU02_12800 [Polyangiaceae bacterium]|nr:hypothetical protein [Polyangiaceae bacterium]